MTKIESMPPPFGSDQERSICWQKFKDRLESVAEKVPGYFLMTRPYSWIEYPMIALVVKSLETDGSVSLSTLSIIDLASLFSISLMWAGLCWNLEAEHKHPGRPEISRQVTLCTFALAAVIGVIINPLTLVPFTIFYFTSILYSRKEGRNDFLGYTSFLVRGIGQAAVYFFSQLLYSSILMPIHFSIGIVICLVLAARNLIGDLRDIRHDEKTFCKVFGETQAKFVAVGLKLGAAVALYSVTDSAFDSVLLSFPLIVESILTLTNKNYQNLHRISVLGTSVTLGNLILETTGLGTAVILTDLIYLSGLINVVFYMKVPRSSNQDYVQ